MAAAPTSSLASSVEKTNGNKLSRLLIDGGTTVLKNLFDSFHPPPYLMARLNANKSVLQTLLKRGVLHKPQWEQLFPPGGTAPDSNTFDITLLFLLLTEICKLPVPTSGWHKPPPAADTSLEANLTRIKLFRNELYGHVTTTGVQTSIFNVKWKEVSAVLVALGLSQTEVDQLKSAPSGEDYVNAITEWVKSDEEIQSKLEEVLQVVKEGNEAQQEINKKLESMNDRGQKDKEHDILKGLAKVNTQSVIEYHAERYQQGTRLSILDKVERWLDDRHSQHRVMVISGHAGMGKSVMSAVLCKRMQEAEKPFLCHFCQYGKARHRNTKVMIQSLASQLSSSLAEYMEALVQNLSRNLGLELNNMEINDLCELLFEESLCGVTDPGKNILVVIDGLDECEYQRRNALLEVIANNFYKFPSWIRFLITTRPEINIADSLKHYQPLQLDLSNEENVRDIRLCFKEKLSDVMQIGQHSRTLRECLHSLFQTVMNEGGRELSSQALSLLEGRYSNIPYMECMHKEDAKVSLQARFLCSAEVVCFDISPHLDYMVCECRDGAIQLWSLHTGKLLWVRPVMVIKSLCHPYEAYRKMPTPVKSFCRSVVFQPGEEVVLPGIVSHAYTLDGEFKSLFSKAIALSLFVYDQFLEPKTRCSRIALTMPDALLCGV